MTPHPTHRADYLSGGAHAERCEGRPASTASHLGRPGEGLATLSTDQELHTAPNLGLRALPLSCAR